MNIMKIPRFNAEASLNRTCKNYCSPALGRASPKRTAVIPQLGGKGFKGFEGCIIDCAENNPLWTHEQCRRSCADPFAGVDLSTPRSWFNDFMSSTGIDLWEVGCSINPYSPPGVCGWLANEMRRQS
jgi:hypothetical protein